MRSTCQHFENKADMVNKTSGGSFFTKQGNNLWNVNLIIYNYQILCFHTIFNSVTLAQTKITWGRMKGQDLRMTDSAYRKNSKIWDTSNNCHNCPKNRNVGWNIALMHPKYADGMANSVDPDQTASSEAVWSWSALFAETYLSQYIEFVR